MQREDGCVLKVRGRVCVQREDGCEVRVYSGWNGYNNV